MALLQRLWNSFSSSSAAASSTSSLAAPSFAAPSVAAPSGADDLKSSTTRTTTPTPTSSDSLEESSSLSLAEDGGGPVAAATGTSPTPRTAPLHVFVSEDSECGGSVRVGEREGEDEDEEERVATHRVGSKLKHFLHGEGWMTCTLVDIRTGAENNNQGEIMYLVRGVSSVDKNELHAEALLTEAEMDCAVTLLSVLVGSRVSLFREDEQSYYNATVTQLREEQQNGFCLYYDFGIEEWVDLSRHRFHLLPSLNSSNTPSSSHQKQKHVASVNAQSSAIVPFSKNTNMNFSFPSHLSAPYEINDVSIGAKVSVRCPGTDTVILADVVRMRDIDCPDRFCLEFEDGTRRWMDLSPENCRVLCLGEREEDMEDFVVGSTEKTCSVRNTVFTSDQSAGKKAAPTANRRERLHDTDKMKSDSEPSLVEAQMDESETHSEDDVKVDDDESIHSEDEQEPSAEPEEVIVGSRVGVWWPGDRKYYNGTVIEYRRMRKRNPFRILYDDDDEEWIDFHKHNFRFLPGSKQRPTGNRGPDHAARLRRVHVGVRIGVWWNLDKEYYEATVQKINKGGAKPYYLVYDDGEKEQIDLKSHDFCILSTEADDEADDAGVSDVESDYSSLLSGDDGASDSDDDDLIDVEVEQGTDQNRPDLNQVTIGTRVAVWWEGDRKFYKGTVSSIRNSKSKYFIKYDDGDKHWIDLSMESFRLLPSSKKVAAKRRRTRSKHLRSTCRENDTSSTEGDNASSADNIPCRKKTKKPKASCRRKRVRANDDKDDDDDDDSAQTDESHERPAKKIRLSKQGKRVAVEQINPKTGKVVQLCSSIRKAETMTGIRQEQIRRALLHEGKLTAGGFFWRIVGTNNKPRSRSRVARRRGSAA